LGEYSALVTAGSIQFYDAIKLVRVRGKAMQHAGIVNSRYFGCNNCLSKDSVMKLVNRHPQKE